VAYAQGQRRPDPPPSILVLCFSPSARNGGGHEHVMFHLAEPQPPRPEDADPPAAPTAGGEPADERASAGEEVNAVLMGLLPWAISILLHLGLVVLALFALWSTYQIEKDEEVIVPSVVLNETPGAPVQQRTTEKRVQERQTRKRVVKKQSQSESQQSLDSKADTETALIGATGMSGGSASPFQTSVASGAEFKVQFMGNRGGNARRIAFLIDASGSLIDTLPFVIEELKNSINKLNEKQRFTVIFFQGNQVIEVPPPGFKRATGETKQQVISWIDLSNHNIIPQGKSNPVPALERALRYRPQLIFLLSDNITGSGAYAVDQRRLLNEIEQANKANTKICTIQFLYPDPLSQLGLPGTMELIAEENGGEDGYTFVSDEELGLIVSNTP